MPVRSLLRVLGVVLCLFALSAGAQKSDTVAAAEGARDKGDAPKEKASAGRDKAESGRDKSESGRDKSESGKDKSESGKDRSETGRERSESGKERAESGKDKAESAKETADPGKDKAEGSRTADGEPAAGEELAKVKAAARQAVRKATLAAADAAKARAAAVAAAASAAAARETPPPAPPEPKPALRSGTAHGGPVWSYEGDHGPAAWAELAPEFATCGKGERQSPIDIRDGIRLELDPITVDYRESAFKVIDTGHTIQANVAGGNFIKVMGRRFSLVQFHFHRPAEEVVEGHQAEMVIHLVHKDAEGKLAVIAVELERGERQPEIQTVWNNLPLERNEEQPASSKIHPAHLLPDDRRYYTYMGSLTTPPCTEGVLWLVMKQPMEVSTEQIDLFARLYPMNARPLQASAGRMIKESN